jgi:superfamily II DNA/RNA helicase
LSQGLRNRRLMALRNGHVQVLVATDVAARGIDVPTITHVFNYGLPMKAEDYTHRIGRTGRAGRDGLAVTFAEFRDRRRIFDIEGFTRQQFKAEAIPGLEPQQRAPQAGRGDFGRGRETPSRDRKFGAPRKGPGFGDSRARGPFDGARQATGAGYGAQGAGRDRDRFADERKGGFDTRFPSAGRDAAARHGDGARRASFDKPVKLGNGGKVFVPRDVKKRPYKAA